MEATKALAAIKEGEGNEEERKKVEAEAHQLKELVEELWSIVEEMGALVERVKGKVEFPAEAEERGRNEAVVLVEALASKALDVLGQMKDFLGLL